MSLKRYAQIAIGVSIIVVGGVVVGQNTPEKSENTIEVAKLENIPQGLQKDLPVGSEVDPLDDVTTQIKEEATSKSELASKDEAEAEKLGSLDPIERDAIVAEKMSEMSQAVDKVVAMRDKVKVSEKDVKSLNCMNEKLAAMRGFFRVSQDAGTNYNETGEPRAKEHYFRLLAIGFNRIKTLEEEAYLCVGNAIGDVKGERREVYIDEDIAEHDPVRELDTNTIPVLPDGPSDPTTGVAAPEIVNVEVVTVFK